MSVCMSVCTMFSSACCTSSRYIEKAMHVPEPLRVVLGGECQSISLLPVVLILIYYSIIITGIHLQEYNKTYIHARSQPSSHGTRTTKTTATLPSPPSSPTTPGHRRRRPLIYPFLAIGSIRLPSTTPCCTTPQPSLRRASPCRGR